MSEVKSLELSDFNDAIRFMNKVTRKKNKQNGKFR